MEQSLSLNFKEPSREFYWKVGLFGPFNICIMLLHKFFECYDLPLNWIYVVLQDFTMWIEFRHQCSEVDWRMLTLDVAWSLVLNAGWTISLFLFSFFGIHAVVIRELTMTKPEYCKELMERLGFT